jgi:hypothetical protein
MIKNGCDLKNCCLRGKMGRGTCGLYVHLYVYIYIYIIYTPILTSSAFVLGCEREHDRFKQAREEAAKEAERKQERAREKQEEARRKQERAEREQ